MTASNTNLMDDHLYDYIIRRRSEKMRQMREFQDSINNQKQLNQQAINLMDRMCSDESSIGDVLGGFVNYKINWYRNKIDVGVKKMRGEIVCDSDIIMADLLEP